VSAHPVQLWDPSEIDCEADGAVIGAPFIDEPIFVSVVTDDAERAELCKALFTVNIRHAGRFASCWAAGHEVGHTLGIAYWTPQPEVEIRPEIAAGLGYPALGARWGHYLARLGAMEAGASAPLFALGIEWRYLAGVGVAESARGRGIGTRLVERILDDTDAAGIAVGLVTDRARNVPWYEGFSFVSIATGMPAGGPQFWTMLRR
jgi:GNAT superfamily N-acetyltransferase